MKKNITRLFSVLLAAVLVFGTLPVSAMGTDVADPPASTVDDAAVAASAAEPEEVSADDAAQPEEQSAEEEAAVTYASSGVQYKIVHLDCGRKYFSKDWIIALLYEMKNDGYNQLQLAFGNDGLRFLLDDMSFEANGTTYTNNEVVEKVKAGNAAQNESGDSRYLTEAEMDDIIAKANELGIEIVPLLNLPGHANAILDIAGDEYNASDSDNTLNVADSAKARAFGMAIFQKYVDYFAGKGCKFFNFGADEYANDADGTFSFGRLSNTQYQSFVSFINDLAEYVIGTGMTPRAFNDGFYYNGKTMDANTSLKSTQICYWSPGWNGYNLAAASTIKNNHYSLINTNGDYYYVLGKHDKFTPETQKNYGYQDGVKSDYNTHDSAAYSRASSFDNSVFPTYNTRSQTWSTENVQGTAGSMFCIWCDYPNFETEQEVAANTRLVLRAMAQRMDNQTVNVDASVIENGFNEDGSINKSSETTDPNAITITPSVNAKAIHVNDTFTLAASKEVLWSVDNSDVIELSAAATQDADGSNALQATEVTATAKAAGTATITATDPNDAKNSAQLRLTVTDAADEKTITVAVGQTGTITVSGEVTTVGKAENTDIAEIGDSEYIAAGKTVNEVTNVTDLDASKQYIIATYTGNKVLTKEKADYSQQNLLALSSENSSQLKNETNLWTLTSAGNNSFTVASGTGNYLYMTPRSGNSNNADVAVSSSSQGFTFEHKVTEKIDYWLISYKVNNKTYYLNYYSNQGAYAGGWSTSSPDTDDNNRWRIYEVTNTDEDKTEIPVTGKKAGTTYVTIDGAKYTIVVTPAPLKIEYWITNGQPDTGATEYSLSASADGVASKEGVDITSFLPKTVSRSGRTQEYWKATMLNADEENDSTSGTELQCVANGDDETWSGQVFTKVRYFNNEWQVRTDSEWVTVDQTPTSQRHLKAGCDGTGGEDKDYEYYTGARNQLVAYYMEVLDIANNTSGETELHVNAADWGIKADGTSSWGYTPDNTRCTVSVQIVYEDGTNPVNADAESLKSKTFEYGLGSERGLGTMIFNAEQNYTITKIGAVTGNMEDSRNGQKFTVTKFDWNNDEQVVWGGNEGDSAKTASIYNSSKTPDSENKRNLTWIKDKNNAILIRVYVKTVETSDSLHVHYMDRSNNDEEFYVYPINVKAGTLFKNDFALLEDGTLTGNDVRTDVGTTRYVQVDLKKLSEIGAQYRYTNYTCVKATRSVDGKDVYLYYTFDDKVSFVVDFGTPLKIKPADINSELATTGVTIQSVAVQQAGTSHGEVIVNDDKSFTFTPNTAFVSSESGEKIQVTYTGTKTYTDESGTEQTSQLAEVAYQVYIYPASNVLYEEDFLTDDSDNGVDTGWTKVPGSHTTAQETQKVGDEDKNLFGYDESYQNATNANGVWKAENLGIDGGMNITKTLNTEFYGNTFDLIGNCNKTTGRVVLVISEKENPKVGKIIDIDTRYNDGNICQVPLAHVVMGTEDKDYNVEIYAARLAETTVTTTPRGVATMSLDDADAEIDDVIAQILEENGMSLADVEYERVSMMDRLNATSAVADVPGDAVATYADEGKTIKFEAGTHVEIDGFRVYRTTDAKNNVAKNYPVNEQDKTYWNIIDVMQGEIIEAYRDNGQYTSIEVSKYEKAGGPQNEIYLASGQSIAFKIDNVSKIQVSLRAVNSTPVTWNSETITSNTEMYYPVEVDGNGNFVITNSNNEGDGLLAIGNVKIESTVTQDDIKPASGIDQEALKASVLAVLNGGTEEPEVFTPDTFTAKATATKVIRNKVVTLKVTVSSDVAYVTINGVKYTRTGFQSAFNKNRTILVVNTVPKNETKTYEIVAYNADSVASETKTVTG